MSTSLYMNEINMVYSYPGLNLAKKKNEVQMHTTAWTNLEQMKEVKEARHESPHVTCFPFI